MIRNSELRLRLIKSELVQIDLVNSEAVDVELFNKLFNVIISDRLQIAQEIYKLIDYNTEHFGYTDIRTVDYIYLIVFILT